nr:hypothetical protein CFP56_57910 [Quercus suber]
MLAPKPRAYCRFTSPPADCSIRAIPAVHFNLTFLEVICQTLSRPRFSKATQQIIHSSMSATPLHDIWEASAGQPFTPSIGKDSQFAIGAVLLLSAFFLTALFGLSKCTPLEPYRGIASNRRDADNSLKNLPVYGIPASLAFGRRLRMNSRKELPSIRHRHPDVAKERVSRAIPRSTQQPQQPRQDRASLRKFHPVTSTLVILWGGISAFLIVYNLTYYSARYLQGRWQ